jgi:hypothetical protein
MHSTEAPRSVILLDGSAVIVHGDAEEIHVPAIAVQTLERRFQMEVANAPAPLDHDELVDIIEQAIFETDTGLEAAMLAADRISTKSGTNNG